MLRRARSAFRSMNLNMLSRCDGAAPPTAQFTTCTQPASGMRRQVGYRRGAISPDRWECAIPSSRATRVLDVWKRALQGMPADAEPSGYTDTSIHWFAMNIDGRDLGGMTWSPNPNSIPRLMIELTENMATFCRTSNWWFGSIISEWYGTAADNQVVQILSRLPEPPQ